MNVNDAYRKVLKKSIISEQSECADEFLNAGFKDLNDGTFEKKFSIVSEAFSVQTELRLVGYCGTATNGAMSGYHINAFIKNSNFDDMETLFASVVAADTLEEALSKIKEAINDWANSLCSIEI